MAKQLIHWSQVHAGDIVSFRYKSSGSKGSYMQTILVLNPRTKMKLKDGTSSEKVIGLKLEQSNRRIIKFRDQRKLFESVGELKIVDEESKIYRLEIADTYQAPWPVGVKKNFYTKIKRQVLGKDIYRVYTWDKVPKMVYLEPIVLK